MTLKKTKDLYFLGIAGTGMASAAGLCQEAGFKVSGSDAVTYPPMSTMLDQLGIAVATPYDPRNIAAAQADTFIIGNCVSKSHPEVEAILASGRPYTSFPAFLGEHILSTRQPITITGTHGKTTTASLSAHVLRELGYAPGYLIGGLPKNLDKSFSMGSGDLFVMEGDEYDTAFFDKGSKFLHYQTKVCLVNNLEFDHADIFDDFEAILTTFSRLLKQIKDPELIVANVDCSGVRRLLQVTGLESTITTVSTLGQTPKADVVVAKSTPTSSGWKALIETRLWGPLEIETVLTGTFNIANIAQICGMLAATTRAGMIAHHTPDEICRAIASFPGVRRRMELLAEGGGVRVFEDFAHHPTAVKEVISNLRRSQPNKRIVVAFEPKSASSRRSVFLDNYVSELAQADLVLLGRCVEDVRLEQGERMDTALLAKRIGGKAHAFSSNDLLYSWLADQMAPNDTIVFMSPGDFSGIHHRLASAVSAGNLPQ